MLFRSGSSGTNCFSKWKLTLGEARELPRRGRGVGGAGKGCRKSDLMNTFSNDSSVEPVTPYVSSPWILILDIPPDSFSRDE